MTNPLPFQIQISIIGEIYRYTPDSYLRVNKQLVDIINDGLEHIECNLPGFIHDIEKSGTIFIPRAVKERTPHWQEEYQWAKA